MKTQIMIVLAGALLAGCAMTPDGLKENPENKASFRAADGYQTVFKRIVDANRECAPVPLLPLGQVIADAQLFSDLKLGTLTLGASGVGTQIYQVIEVQEIAPSESLVTLYAAARRDGALARLKKWANGEKTCAM